MLRVEMEQAYNFLLVDDHSDSPYVKHILSSMWSQVQAKDFAHGDSGFWAGQVYFPERSGKSYWVRNVDESNLQQANPELGHGDRTWPPAQPTARGKIRQFWDAGSYAPKFRTPPKGSGSTMFKR